MANLTIYNADPALCLGPKNVNDANTTWLETHQEGDDGSNRTKLSNLALFSLIRTWESVLVYGDGSITIGPDGGIYARPNTGNSDGSTEPGDNVNGWVRLDIGSARASPPTPASLANATGWSPVVVITTDHTLDETEAGRTLVFDSASDITLTISDNANVPYPLAGKTEFLNKNTGNVLFAPLNPDVVLLVNGTFTLGQNGGAAIKLINQSGSINEFWFGGGLS